jgi:hypothetical protein
MDTDDLFELVETKADKKHNGCFMLVKTAMGWKVLFGTYNYAPGIIDAIEDGLSLNDALRLAIIQDPVIGD